MKKSTGWIVLILIAAILGGMIFYASSIIKDTTGKTNGQNNIKLGLDLAGGVSITYQIEGDFTQEQVDDTIYKLQKRIENDLSNEAATTEASVYQQGDDRIVVEIPGVTDANALLEDLGKPGTLEFQTPDGKAFLTGDMIASAEAGTQQDNLGNNEYVVKLTLTDEGAKTFGAVTTANVGNRLPIVYDGNIISNPVVQAPILGGSAVITGMADFEEAESLASYIRIGSLSLQLTELQSNVVGAQLGSNAVSTSLLAGAIGIAIAMVFMIAVYFVPGVVAAVALALYTTFILAILQLYDITLTLPGIAGIILSIGMAVDANVIIYARIREEIAAGVSVRGAIDSGFKKAFSAIFDGNITTLIAAAVLGVKGSGTVKGFAITLAIGVVLSMFTALVVSKLIVNALYAIGVKNPKAFGKEPGFKTIGFINKKAIFFIISCAVVAVGAITMVVNGVAGKGAFNLGLDFVGGTSTQVEFDKDYSISEIESDIIPLISAITKDNDIQTQKVDGGNDIIFKTRSLNQDERTDLYNMFEEKFGVAESHITQETISGVISGEMTRDAIVAVIISAILMLIYIWIRFSDLRMASSAIIALIHDVLVVLTFYALSRISVTSAFIACILTVIGYSVNDTIVIFDRIRENRARLSVENAETLKELANKSLTQTLSRTICTSFTTLVMVVMLYILGVESIRLFAFPLTIGTICGTYSSIGIAVALWYVMSTRKSKKN
ncbi:MAG: protein translocase subunit SecD [Lachnospiraceae bacterium]|nr:protein translocase subunit SecD [Lachnospiraceae bacterium]